MKNIFNLKQKTIVITGGYGYLGQTISKGLLDFGAKVVILGRSEKKFNKAFYKMENISFVECDVTDSKSTKTAFNYIFEQHKSITHLINNVTFTDNTDISIFPKLENWNKGINGSLSSVYNCIKEVQPYFKNNNISKIINMGSMYGVVSPDFKIYKDHPTSFNPSHYGASKAAINQLTKYFAALLGENNILVNTVSPGPFPNKDIQKNTDFIKKLQEKTAINRIGLPSDLIGVFVLLCSDASNFITGQNFIVDGGWTIN